MRSLSSVIRLATGSFILLNLFAMPVQAATGTTSSGSLSTVQSVAQSYQTAKPLQQGLIVQVDTKTKGSVKAALYKESKKMLGVIVAANTAPVSLTTDADTQKAYVVTSGRYNVLLSNQNGIINAGDYVSISAIGGIGMKADTAQETILGRAVGSFDGKANVLSKTTLKQSDGKELQVAIGSVAVDIQIAPNKNRQTDNKDVPKVIQSLAKTIVGKEITATQLYISAAILIAGLSVVASLLYGGIQTGMLAIGRNPLARSSITRNIVQVLATGIMIFIGCLIAVYLVLKL